jgi:predicted nuclease with TOPRIM domain
VPATMEPPSNASSSSGAAPAQVDDLLMRLNTHLEQVSSSIPDLQRRLARLAESSSGLEMLDEVQERWEDAQVEWEDIVRDVELLKEELKEDRWLVIFRCVRDTGCIQKVSRQC